jgi:ABC-type transport system involved in cytochrome bd biosynthesis fused ATPase/permease subunit
MGYVTDIEIPAEQHIDSLVKITSAPEISIKTLNHPDLLVEIKPGQKVGILGMPGSGRTAILRAILGEQHGQLNLKINNIPVRNVSSEEYNDFTGICFQSSTLFEGTIAENIALREDYDKSEISKLIEVTHLNRFVEEQEHGFEQKIDIQSGGLPNNIARKVLLARALYGQPDLLLIDDIWNVFTREELSKIIQYIGSLKSTVIIISNVLPVLEQMDKMLFFDNNMIEEYNSPELLNHNPKIKNIVWM